MAAVLAPSAGVREHYEHILSVAKHAAREFSQGLAIGLPRLDISNPDSRAAHSRIRELANSHVWASRALWNAAIECEREEGLPDGTLEREVLL